MNKLLNLSYPISKNSPLYPGTSRNSITSTKSITEGDSCNTFMFTISNHAGTHIDAPNHFWGSGKSISSYDINELYFTKPLIVNCPKSAEEPIEINDFENIQGIEACDILLIRTGFYKLRDNDPEQYTTKNPYLAPATADWFRKSFPRLKAIGLDTISVALHTNKSAGKETHKTLLREEGYAGRAILIIEDMYLPDHLTKLDEIMVCPIFIEGIDSAPCTIVGIIHD